MIVKKHAVKQCDICKDTVAIKEGLFYENVDDYFTLRGDTRWNRNKAVHICSDCWDKMKRQIVDILGRKIK